MSAIEVQIRQEVNSRIGVVALLGPEVYRLAEDWAVTVPGEWCRLLADPATAAEVAPDFYRALYPHGAPVEWWGTELGRRLASVGFDPGGECSTREAAALLGWPLTRAKRHFGSGKLPLRAVLDELGGVPGS